MELASRKRLMVFSGSGNEPLAEEVANILGVRLGGVERSIFANGEIYVHYTESVRGADTFVIQSHTHPINFHIMEQLIMIDALMRASAKRITAVVPFYGYSRQDKKGRPNVEAQQKMNKEVMDLYKKEGVNPAGGCVPMLLQFPVFIAFYQLLAAAIELRGAPWIFWVQDLSLKDY